jgi:flagellar assembly protein FliH
LFKAKLVRHGTVKAFSPPSFEGAADVFPAGRAEGRKGARASSPSPADVEREAYLRGLEAGEKAGAEHVAREAAPILSGLKVAVEALNALREQFARDAEPQVVDLAVAIARRIVIEELSLRPDLIAGIVKEAIRKIERGGTVTVKVHPDLYNLMESLKDELAGSRTQIAVDVDPSVPPAGPIVTGTMEEVLTDVDDQIRVIVEELRSARAKR